MKNPVSNELVHLLENLRAIFLEHTGYGRSDIMSINYLGYVITRNGGQYRVRNGRVQWIAGPPVDLEDRD